MLLTPYSSSMQYAVNALVICSQLPLVDAVDILASLQWRFGSYIASTLDSNQTHEHDQSHS